jgi:conjugal transfer pilus assembly protein TraB
LLAGVVIVAFVGLIYAVSDDSTAKNKAGDIKADFVNPLAHVDAESIVLERTQKQLKDSDIKSAHLQEQIDSLIKEKQDGSSSQAAYDLKKRIDALEQQLQQPAGQPNPTANPMAGSQEFQGNFLPPAGSPNAQNLASGDPSGQGIREDTLSLSKDQTENSAPLKNPDTYVPAGTFAKAVMIGGADASAAVNAQSNPSPMLFRIVENGTLPNHEKSHLKDCVVTAAVVGDISSERGLIRLESLSCTFPSKEIVDQSVEGTIFGSEGKNGVRGNPVWREGALLQRAFAAGALSGISEGISQTYTTNSISPQGNVATIEPSKVAQVGLGKGIGKAMDKLADYNIQRAEQYHPVIQLSAGAVVDVVFLKGFFLDGKKHENQDTSVGNYSSSIQSQGMTSLFAANSEEAQTLPLSPDAVKRIQEHSKELGLRVSTQTGT